MPAGLAQPADDAEAVEARHHHVEHQQVGAERVGQRQRLLPVGRGGHLEARRTAGWPTAARGCSARRRRRAGGPRGCCARSARLPATDPPVGRAGAVVMRSSVRAPRLRSVWTLPVNSLCGPSARAMLRASAGGRHGPAAPPVADRVVLRPAQSPAAAQVGADRPDGGRLRAHPGEDVVALGPVQRGDGVDQQRALARAACRRGAASARRSRPAPASGCSSSGPATSSRATPAVRRRGRGEDAG